jgi:hypothetical protein
VRHTGTSSLPVELRCLFNRAEPTSHNTGTRNGSYSRRTRFWVFSKIRLTSHVTPPSLHHVHARMRAMRTNFSAGTYVCRVGNARASKVLYPKDSNESILKLYTVWILISDLGLSKCPSYPIIVHLTIRASRFLRRSGRSTNLRLSCGLGICVHRSHAFRACSVLPIH